MLSAGCNCWIITCECGEVNGGCVRMGVHCSKCGEPIDFSNHPYLNGFLGVPTYKPNIQIIYKGLGIEFKEDYQI
jgi:hypothetical protein